MEYKTAFAIMAALCVSIIFFLAQEISGNIFLLDAVFGKIPPLLNMSEPIVWASSNSVAYVVISLIQIVTLLKGTWTLLLLITAFILVVWFFLKEKYSSILVASSVVSFLVLNPFFYERLMSGQWFVILGYLTSIIFIGELLVLVSKKNENLSPIKALSALFVVGCFSFHFLAIGVVLFCIASLFVIHKRTLNEFQVILIKYIKALALFILCSLYWLIPLILDNFTHVNGMNIHHWYAYMTTINPEWGWLLSVFSLYGFWGEHYYWSYQFFWVTPHPGYAWYVSVLILMSAILFGFVLLLRRRHSERNSLLFLLIIIFVSAIFSLGVSDSPFYLLNKTLLEHVPFWDGFRDSQKWSGVIAIGFAYAYAEFARYILGKYKHRWEKIVITTVLVMLPMSYTPMILVNQLWTVDYPKGWYVVDEIISMQSPCKMIFLPWHQYYYVSFNKFRLTGNPSRNFFSCRVYSSLDPEHGLTGLPKHTSQEERDVHEIVTLQMTLMPEIAVTKLRNAGVNYIVLTELAETTHEYASLLSLKGVSVVYRDKDIILIRLH